MKKRILIIILYGILVFVIGCTNKEKVNDYEKFLIGNTLDDGRVIHFSFDVPYKDIGLSFALSNKKITIDEFINELEYIEILRDGGSKIYKYNKNKNIFGNEEFNVIVCNSLDNIKDIYVTKNKESLYDKCSIKMDDLDGVSMTIKKDSLTNTGVTLIITDTSNRKNIYGENYRIDKLENGIWSEAKIVLDDNYAWNSIGYQVGKNNKLEMDINWEWLYGKLSNGTYRIVKDTSEVGEEPNHYLTAEFIIE